jgi:hypothetical protein
MGLALGRRTGASEIDIVLQNFSSVSRVQEDKQFFFENKNQETFVVVACVVGEGRDRDVYGRTARLDCGGGAMPAS